MALRNGLAAGQVGERLAGWLPVALGAEKVDVTGVDMPSASGMSCETVLIDAVCDGDPRGLVVRVAPAEGGLFHTYDLGREARVMTAVAEHTDARVPRVLAHEQTGTVLGTEFLLIERAYGQVPSDDPPFGAGGWCVDLTPTQQAKMYDEALKAIVAIQLMDPVAAGLSDLKHVEFGATVPEQELEYWKRFYAWAADGRSVPTIDQALDVLGAQLPTPEGPLVVSWGDARFGNLMFGPDQEVTGIFDWEMAGLGRHEADLGYFLYADRMFSAGMGLPRLAGFPTREDAIARYTQLSGRSVRDLQWFEAYAGLRCSILMARVGYNLIAFGILPEDSATPYSNPCTQSLAEVLNLPAPAGTSGWIEGRS